MSILIKGLNVPEDGMIGVFISSDGNVYDSMDDIVGTIVPVPPHERLIDADALETSMHFACMGVMAGTDPYSEPLKVLEDAPTIIEAEVDDG